MRELWCADSGLTVADVLEALNDPRPAYTTVMTILDRLREKGWVDRVKDGRSFRYTPLSDPNEYIGGLLDRALSTAPDRQAALVRFAGTLTSEEARALQAALQGSALQDGSGDTKL